MLESWLRSGDLAGATCGKMKGLHVRRSVWVRMHGALMLCEQGEGEGKGCKKRMKTRSLRLACLTRGGRKVTGAWTVLTLQVRVWT